MELLVETPPVPERWGVCGRLERLAYERAIRDRERLPALGYWWDQEAADHAVEVISRLRHTKGRWARRPWQWTPWQEWATREIYGWKRADGTRRFRWAYIEISRKNGKTEWAAANGVYLQIADGEHGAEVYSAATKKDQARIAFGAASEMVRLTPELRTRVKPLASELRYPPLNSTFAPLGADADTLDGMNPHGLIIDELHAHRDRRVLDVLQTATGARDQPLGFIIGTAGIYDPQSVGWVTHQAAVAVLEEEVEDHEQFVFIASADAELDFEDPVAARQANPSMGYTVTPEYIAQQAAKAAREPSFRATFERYHLDRWTQVAEVWLDMQRWRAAPSPTPLAEEERPKAWAGLDLSSKVDITALVVAVPRQEGGQEYVDLDCRFWVPEATIQRRSREDRVPYDAWERDGWVTATPGDVIDFAWIRREVLEMAERYDLQELAYDEWAAQQMALELAEEGITMVPTRQGFRSLSEPAKELEALVVSRRLRHGNHPVLTWMAARCSISHDPAGNIKPDKKKSRDRIDGIAAAVMAIGRMILRPRQTPSDGTIVTWIE